MNPQGSKQANAEYAVVRIVKFDREVSVRNG